MCSDSSYMQSPPLFLATLVHCLFIVFPRVFPMHVQAGPCTRCAAVLSSTPVDLRLTRM